MPYDGSGNFTRSYNFTADKLAAIKIQSTRMDGEFDNYATAMNLLVLRNGVAAMTGDLKLGANKITGISSGLVGTPALQFTADATTGIYLQAAGAMGFVAGGTERARVNTNGLGVVGALGVGAAFFAARTTLDIQGISSFRGVFEDCTVSATAISGTINIDLKPNALTIFDSNATANFIFNIRGDVATSIDALMAIGQAATLAIEVPQGATPYYCTSITIDGGAPSQLRWFGGAPAAGNASGIDVYTITIIKKAGATFYVRASQLQVKP